MAYVSIVVLAVVCNGILFLTRWRLGGLFGASESIRIMVGEVLPVFLIGLIFYGFSHITTSGFYATEKNLYSYICVYGEPAFLLALLVPSPGILGAVRRVVERGALHGADGGAGAVFKGQRRPEQPRETEI